MAGLDRVDTVDPEHGVVEVGYTEVLQKHFSRHVVQRAPITQKRLDFEHRRPQWLRECVAEATGVFFYVYPGIGSIASFVLNVNNPANSAIIPAFSSFFQIGWGFAIGIAFAIIVCAPVSGGHFNPAITLCLAYWQGFPWRKVPYFICSQIFGSFMAGLIVVGQYWPQISAFKEASIAAGKGTVYNPGPASILCSIPNPDQTNLGWLFMNEFFVASFIAILIWACLDPANPFVSPQTIPFTIGLVYATMVWGFADITISTNLARDLGTRIVAAIFFGHEAFTYHHYAWIAILVNIPATFFGTAFYELFFRDSLQKIAKGAALHESGEYGLSRHITKTRLLESSASTQKSVSDDEGPVKEH